MLPPLLGAAKARLGASSSRRRQWVESEPFGPSSADPSFLGMPRESIPDLQMATWDAYLHPERDAYEEPERQFSALTQQASIEIPIGVLAPQVIALSLGPRHYSRPRSIPSPDLKSRTFGGAGAGAGAGVGLELRDFSSSRKA